MMGIDTHRFARATSYEPLSMIRRAKVHNAPIYLPVRIQTKASFTIPDTHKGSSIIVDTGKRVEPISARRETSYFRMPFMTQKRSVVEKRLERLEEQLNDLVSSTWSYLFDKRDIEQMRELSKGMLEDSKWMQKLAEQLKETEDEG